MSDVITLLRNKKPVSETVNIAVDDDTTVEIIFNSIGRKRYLALVDDYTVAPEKPEPVEGEEAKADDDDESEETLDFENFIMALVAESIYEPAGVTIDDVKGWADEWNGAEFDALAGAAMRVNSGSRVGETVKD